MMKRSLAVLALVALVFMSGCTETSGDNEESTQIGDSTTGASGAAGNYISLTLENFPSVISEGEELRFNFKVEAHGDLEDVEVLMYDFGSHIESSCNGRNKLGDMLANEIKIKTCTLKISGEPTQEIRQEMKYELNFKIKKLETELSMKVYDNTEYERSAPAPGSDFGALGSFGGISIEPKNVEEGRPVNVEIDLDDSRLVKNNLCNCHIEKLTFSVPTGFLVQGLSEWTKKSCGSDECYSTTNVNAPLKKEFTVAISGVTRSNEFYVKTTVEGIWEYVLGSQSFTILHGEELE
ncbi:MAG: hypothetical protein GOV00_00835 [Candidatus Altiarchaeota archaeon]|nr:hypothetical protein [Candidatus Altiarchaeota archaeon]